MSSSSSPDRESFEQLLADAFAVQQSQMDSQVLSAIVEVQRLIAKGEVVVVDGSFGLRVTEVLNSSERAELLPR